MIGCLYGALPVAHDTGGLHDTISPMSVDNNSGNGFLFEVYDANGLWWAIKQAMRFYDLPLESRRSQIERVMQQSASTFNHARTARQYMDLYEKMLDRPLITLSAGTKRAGTANT
jgi:starch synthase/alpha-amylase